MRRLAALLVVIAVVAACNGGAARPTDADGTGVDAPDGNEAQPDGPDETPGDAADRAPGDLDAPPADHDAASEQDAGDERWDAEPTPDGDDAFEPRPDGDEPDAASPDAEFDAPTDADDPGDNDAAEAEVEPVVDADESLAPLFDTALLADAAQADCAFAAPRTVVDNGRALTVHDLTYTSYEYNAGVQTPIRIHGYAAWPVGAERRPGVVQAHGLGGFAEEKHATALAARLNAAAAAYTGPGGVSADGRSRSTGEAAGGRNGYRMFDTRTDVRGSWFWAHAAAAMRALTCLATRREVNPDRLGVTGFSAGGVVTTMAVGVDPRVKAGVALSGTGAWFEAVRSPSAWQHQLLRTVGLDTASPEWLRLMAVLDPSVVVANRDEAPLFMANGTTDEFFPLTAHAVTFNAVRGAAKRTSLAANFDHGCYGLTGVESAQTIEQRAALRADGAQSAFFGVHLGTDNRLSAMPPTPAFVQPASLAGALTLVGVAAPTAGTGAEVEKATYWVSGDGGCTYVGADLSRQGDGLYGGLLPIGFDPAAAPHFVDVQYRAGSAIAPLRFSLSTPPVLPAGFVPLIRAIDACVCR